MRRVKQAFRGSDDSAYRGFKEGLRELLRALKAETGVSRAAEAETGVSGAAEVGEEERQRERQRRVRALLQQVLELFSPPALAGLPTSLKPLLPREWRDEWSRTLAKRHIGMDTGGAS